MVLANYFRCPAFHGIVYLFRILRRLTMNKNKPNDRPILCFVCFESPVSALECPVSERD